MSDHSIVEEARSLVRQIEDSREKIIIISKQNAVMRALLVDKNNRILEQEQKIEEMTRLLVLADKMLSEMKEKLYKKEEKEGRLSEKLSAMASGIDGQLSEMQKNLRLSEENAKKLGIEKESVQKKLVALLSIYEKSKTRARYLDEKLKESAINLPPDNKKSIEALRKSIEAKENELHNLSGVLNESQQKIRSLEEINTKLDVQYSQEKEILRRLLGKREEEIKKLSVMAAQARPVQAIFERKEKPVISIPKTFDPFEKKEIESMIKIALSHGDSIEKIKESLLNAGYEKEKIEEIVRKRA